MKTSFQCSMIILSSIVTVDNDVRNFRSVERVVVFIIVASVAIPRLGQLRTCQGGGCRGFVQFEISNLPGCNLLFPGYKLMLSFGGGQLRSGHLAGGAGSRREEQRSS